MATFTRSTSRSAQGRAAEPPDGARAARRPDQTPVLWHITVSNFNEKARWALDYKAIPHYRRAPMPMAHMLVALALTRRIATLPVVRLDGKTIGDSTRIIAALEDYAPDPPLYPADPAQRRRALELEQYFDEHLGPDVRRIVFWHLLREPELLRSRVGAVTTPRQGRVLSATMPAARVLLARRYAINDRTAGDSLLKIRAAMRLIEDLLAGGDYLVGERFTVADLTAAALLGPLLRPSQYPSLPPENLIPQDLAGFADELRELPAGRWLLRTYQRHRPASAEITEPPGGQPAAATR